MTQETGPGHVEAPDLEVVEHGDARQLDVLATHLPEALRAAADWLTEHGEYAVTALNCSLIDNGVDGKPRPTHLITISLVNDDVGLMHSALAYRRGSVGVGGGVPADQVSWTGRGIFRDKPVSAAWSADLAEEVLQHTRPSGRAFMRALVAEGGRATPARLCELTGADTLHHAVQTLNRAARKLVSSNLLGDSGRRLILPARDPNNPSHPNVYEYVLPEQLVPLFADAISRLDG